LGGLHQLWGTVAGSALLTLASAELGRHFDHWRGALGLVVMLIMVLSPTGLLGLVGRLGRRRAA
jgi:branched-chain amino acid transport system permease protein